MIFGYLPPRKEPRLVPPRVGMDSVSHTAPTLYRDWPHASISRRQRHGTITNHNRAKLLRVPIHPVLKLPLFCTWQRFSPLWELCRLEGREMSWTAANETRAALSTSDPARKIMPSPNARACSAAGCLYSTHANGWSRARVPSYRTSTPPHATLAAASSARSYKPCSLARAAPRPDPACHPSVPASRTYSVTCPSSSCVPATPSSTRALFASVIARRT